LRVLEGRRYGMSIKEKANDLAVGIRTIRRDHQRPPRIGIPLVAIDGQQNDAGLHSPSSNHGETRPVARQ
jgi:predicted DNA-binding transcriptional regulator YafY